MKPNEKIFVAKVVGHSMEPLFEKEDIALVRKISLRSSKRGDVIVYKEGANSLVHRCIRIIKGQNGISLVAKGDNLSFLDPCVVTENEFLGKVVGFIKRNKNLSCENLLWKIVNLLLWGLSIFQFYIVLATDKLKKRFSKSIIYICLRVPLKLMYITSEKFRYALVRLSIRCALLLS